ncbi:hypothetical protein [Helicobacter cetorum]|uniref:hypothetical protein n=1 Tax=Helicobacter cetorum TaxID=138563 RepID=UPI000CF18F01|nr:hypothetical protein [Helicobacter cetorum]
MHIYHQLHQELVDLGVCSQDIEVFFSKKNKNIDVLRCKKSGVLFLSQIEHMGFEFYEKQQDFNYWGVEFIACGETAGGGGI